MQQRPTGNTTGTPSRAAVRRRGRRWWRTVATLCLLAPLSLASLAGIISLIVVSRNLPDVTRLSTYRPSETTELWSSDGVLLARLFEENREVVPLQQMPRDLRDATVAIEDHRFFEHRGVDWRGAGRALLRDIKSGRYEQGGSTLTQQLARNVFLSPDKSVRRKAREALLAVQIERRFTKPEILGMYLNQVYYGERSFGAEAAARRYFGKPVQQLTLAESALLAGIPQRPSYFDPYENPKAAVQRRNLVLKRMADTGFLRPEKARAAMAQPLRLAYGRPPRLTARRAPYFVDFVVRQLEQNYGPEAVFRGGLKVQTTLNTRVQSAAEDAVRRGMARSFGRRPTQCALVSVDPHTGYIRAMVGGRDYRSSPFNRAAQAKRQPGSAFKPFVYAAGMAAGMTPYDTVVDEPLTFAASNWRPKNYDHRWHGRVSLRTAMAQSINIPAIKVLDQVGPDAAIEIARKCGIRSELRDDLTLALGTSEVSALELAGAYGVFATGGAKTETVAIVSVKDSHGAILESALPAPDWVIEEQVARRVDFMLRAVVTEGTGRNAGVVPEARGKTGTTDNLYDAWFVGYTPDLVAAVWVGNDKPSRIPNVTGGGVCAPIWADYMASALRVLPRHPRPKPPAPPKPDIHVAKTGEDAVTATEEEPPPMVVAPPAPIVETVRRNVCLETGLLAAPNCPRTATQEFETGTEPQYPCPVHAPAEPPEDTDAPPAEAFVMATLCRDSGELAGANCPRVVTRRIPVEEAVLDVCHIHRARTSANPTEESVTDMYKPARLPSVSSETW